MASFSIMAGEVQSADAAVREALTIVAAIDPQGENIPVVIENIAFVRALQGELSRSALLLSFVRASLSRTGVERSVARRALRSRIEALLERGLADDERAALQRRGPELTAQEAIEVALS